MVMMRLSVPVKLTVLPEIEHNIKFFKNDDAQNLADKELFTSSRHPVFTVYAGNQPNVSVNTGFSVRVNPAFTY
ncbi:hypothetical protein UM538_12665 [Staphylococcus aureus]|nr:hypothetical protein UM538_12665 [Staphylococcus aureus]